MTAEEQRVMAAKRKVVVGVRFDDHTSELLDWAIVKVAEPGDCVIALHICRNSDSPAKAQTVMGSYLDDYGGLCEQKQVGLFAQVVQGSSIRKVLVKEAKNHTAAAILVGINNHKHLGGRVSIAKYCAKQLPLTTEVMAVYQGKIVYRKNSNPQRLGDQRPSLYLNGDANLSKYQSEFGDSEISEMGRISHEVPRKSDDGCFQENENSKDEALCYVDTRSSLSSISLPVENFTLQRPGWPLLKTASAVTQLSQEARKMSVVQWVMNLPNRFQTELPQLKSAMDESDDQASTPFETKTPCYKLFSHDVLKRATSQFSPENIIGKGGSNRVYKGILPDGKPVAVKFLRSSKEALKEFNLEVEIMTRLKHRNITPLLGICAAEYEFISVYEYQSKGNLEENIHGLPWEVRFSIAVDVAAALKYLHNECRRPVIHRDVKSSNILLNDQFEAQLSDFGLSIWGPSKETFLTDNIVGTFGYLAPEYFMYGKISDKVDVYSFGVVLLELLTGSKPIVTETSKGKKGLVMWAKAKLENGDIKGIMDQSLDADSNEAQIQRIALAAKLCLTQSSRLRPKISQILKVLTGEKDAKDFDHIKLELKENNDDEVYPISRAESHLGFALLDVNDNSTSFSSLDQSSPLSVEGYLKTRCS